MEEAPSSCWRKRKTMEHHDLIMTDQCDVDAAAQKLMELSDEEKSNNNNISKRRRRYGEEEVEERPSDDIVMAKIQEIFGKEIEVFPMKKQRRYRSLVNIYMATRPITAGNDRRRVSA